MVVVTGNGVYAETISGQVVGIADGDTLTILDTSKKRYKARMVRIVIPVLHTARTLEMNGEGKAVESQDHPARTLEVSSPALEEAVKAVCQG